MKEEFKEPVEAPKPLSTSEEVQESKKELASALESAVSEILTNMRASQVEVMDAIKGPKYPHNNSIHHGTKCCRCSTEDIPGRLFINFE